MKFTFVPEASPLEGYTIKRAIHRGGFGEVYYALSDSGKEVALKLLNNNLEVELRGVSQCLNLKHPNLVTIFDIREDPDGDHWIVMEYIGGRGLYETLQLHPNGMSIEDTLHWLSGITSGLSFLHDRGIVHRDLKPANVFSDQDMVKVGDVGLSKYISESRRSAQTQSVGTVYYMAPEVCHGRYGREVDVYALGIMLVEMLTGQVPFDGETTAEILMKHMTAEPDLTVVPVRLREVIAAALEKDPEQRIQDVEELERRFRAAVKEMGPADFSVGPETSSRQSQPTSRPKPTVAAQKPPQKPARPVVQPLTLAAIGDYWTNLPMPVRWISGGVIAVIVLETGLLGYITSGAFLGITLYLGYLLVNHFFGQKLAAGGTHTRSGQPVASTVEEPLAPQPTVSQASIDPQPAPPNTTHRHARRQPRRSVRRVVCLNPATPRVIPKRQRLTDLTNSLSISLAATFLVTLAVYLTTSLLPQADHAVYFGAVTMLGAWALIIPLKLREGRTGDVMMRRLMQGAVGLGVGFLAAGLQSYLMLSNDQLLLSADSVGESWIMGRIQIIDGTGYPTLAAFMLFFGILFAARRWWWQTDSFRRSRFRISSTLFTLVVGAVVAGALQFPGALGATWALAISAVVQLSAGWTPPEERLLRQTTRDSLPAEVVAEVIPEPVSSGEQMPVAST